MAHPAPTIVFGDFEQISVCLSRTAELDPEETLDFL